MRGLARRARSSHSVPSRVSSGAAYLRGFIAVLNFVCSSHYDYAIIIRFAHDTKMCYDNYNYLNGLIRGFMRTYNYGLKRGSVKYRNPRA